MAKPLIISFLLIMCLMFAPARRFSNTDQLANANQIFATLSEEESVASLNFDSLCGSNPLDALEESMRSYKKQVESYTCEFVKRERIKGKLNNEEIIRCDFQESPFSLMMRWISGAGRAEAMMYVAGENDEQLLIVPSGKLQKDALKILGKHYAKRAPNSRDAMEASRYPANEFGIYFITSRTLQAWREAHRDNALKVEYRGIIAIPELKGRKCHVLHRTCLTPEEDGLNDVTVMLDAETQLLTGVILKANGQLLGHYYFRDLVLNHKFKNDHFKSENFR